MDLNQFLQSIEFTGEPHHKRFIRFGRKKCKALFIYSNQYAYCIDHHSKEEFRFKSDQLTTKSLADIIVALDAHKEGLRAKADKNINKILKQAKSSVKHPYLSDKKLKPLGVLQLSNVLIIPIQQADNTISSLQMISPNGSKRFIAGGAVKDGFFILNPQLMGNGAIICEGYATGLAIATHYKKDFAVIVAFSAHNLPNIAIITRSAKPSIDIIIAADNDKIGITCANKAANAVNASIATPLDAGDDWCDVSMNDSFLSKWIVKKQDTQVKDARIDPLNGLIKDLTDYIMSTAQFPIKCLIVANVTTFLGALLGRKIRSETDLRTNFYYMGVAPTGSGKDHSRKAIRKIAKKINHIELIGAERFSSGTAVVSSMELNRSQLFMLDEFGLMLGNAKTTGGYKSEILEELLKFYSSAGTTYMGTAYANQKERSHTTMEDPNMCIYATTTLTTLVEGISGSDFSSGLLPRFMFSAVDGHTTKFNSRINLDELPIDIVNKLKILSDINGDISGITDESNPMIFKYHNDKLRIYIAEKVRLMRFDDELKASVYSRVVENAIKLGLLQAACNNKRVIEMEDFDWGFQLAKWSADYLYAMMLESITMSTFHEAYIAIFNFIKKNRNVAYLSISREFIKYPSKIINGCIDRAIADLRIEEVIINQKKHYFIKK